MLDISFLSSCCSSNQQANSLPFTTNSAGLVLRLQFTILTTLIYSRQIEPVISLEELEKALAELQHNFSIMFFVFLSLGMVFLHPKCCFTGNHLRSMLLNCFWLFQHLQSLPPNSFQTLTAGYAVQRWQESLCFMLLFLHAEKGMSDLYLWWTICIVNMCVLQGSSFCPWKP